MDRSIQLEGVVNARDLGGIINTEGKKIRDLCLIRSAKLGYASDEDKQTLTDVYRLKKVIDLRTSNEVAELRDKKISGVENLHMPVFDRVISGISHEENAKYLKSVQGMAGLYAIMVLEDECIRSFHDILKLIMKNDYEDGSILWHCTEGKDRCGLVSAFVLSILKVDYQTIKDDYLLTNIVNEPKAERLYQSMIRSGKTEAEAEKIREMYLAKEEYIDAAFIAINGKYGNIDNYLISGLKLDPELINSFRDEMLS